MKVAAAFLLYALLLGSSIAQECTSITEEEIIEVIANTIEERATEGAHPPTTILLFDFNFNCLAPGCSPNTSRSLTLTADTEVYYGGTEFERQVYQVDIDCISVGGGPPEWAPSSNGRSSHLTNQSDQDLFLLTPTLVNCSECNIFHPAADSTFHCVGMEPYSFATVYARTHVLRYRIFPLLGAFRL